MSTAAAEKKLIQARLGRLEQPDVMEKSKEPTSASPAPAPASTSASVSASASGSGSIPTALATRPADHDHDLPPYSIPPPSVQEEALAPTTTATAARRALPHYQGLPYLDYRLYAPPLFTLSDDQVELKSAAPYLSATVSALAALVRQQATVPPKPQIHIKGTSGSGTVQFDVKMNLMALLVPEDPRQRLNYVRCVGRGELARRGGTKPSTQPEVGGGGSGGSGGGADSAGGDAVEAWCRRFVEDRATNKAFVLERQVANMDLAWIEGQIRSLVATLGFRGMVTVSFPVTHARVVVQSPDRVNRFFTSVATLFNGRSKYEVVKAVWPFATHKNGDANRRCAVQSEEAWWREWREALRHAISTRRRGWVSCEDRLEVLMEGSGKDTAVEWDL